MSIDGIRGRVRWTPQSNQEGSHVVSVQATDQFGLTTVQTFEVSVICGNLPPQLTSIPPMQIQAQAPYFYPIRAVDPEGGPVSIALTDSPAGMTISDAGLIRWTPGDGDIGQTVTVSIRATDAEGAAATQTFELTVEPQGSFNRTPAITSSPDFNVRVGQDLSLIHI